MVVPLLLVDGHNLLWRAAYGFPAEMRSPDGRDVTTCFGFFALLRVAVRDEFGVPPEIVVTFDGEHGSAARKSADAAYKAGRDDEAAKRPMSALPDVQHALDLLGVAWIEDPHAEADDVIATLVERHPDRPVRIMSADRDFYQLLNDRVRVLNTCMQPGRRLIGPAQVFERFGVTPAQYACFRALTGDKSDNIPGVPGIGDKTAAIFLAGGLRLRDLPDSGRLTGAKGRRVLDHWETALRCRDLIRMRTDVPTGQAVTGLPTLPLPRPGDVLTKLGLW